MILSSQLFSMYWSHIAQTFVFHFHHNLWNSLSFTLPSADLITFPSLFLTSWRLRFKMLLLWLILWCHYRLLTILYICKFFSCLHWCDTLASMLSRIYLFLLYLLPCSLGSISSFFMFLFGSSVPPIPRGNYSSRFCPHCSAFLSLTLVPFFINSESMSQAYHISYVSKIFLYQPNEYFQFLF